MSSLIGQYTPRDLEIYIEKNFGDKVSWGGKHKDLVKFGYNSDIGTSIEDIWSVGGVEVLPTGNTIAHFASTNAGDTQSMIVEGHTMSAGGILTFVVQTVTLEGLTKKALTTPLARLTRAYNIGSTDFAGIIYFAKDVTFTDGVPASDIHGSIPVGFNQTQKAATSVSDVDYWVITHISASVRRTQTRSVAIYPQIRELGQVFRTRTEPIAATSDSGSILKPLPQPLIVRPNSDFRLQGLSSGASTEVSAAAHGTLFIKESTL